MAESYTVTVIHATLAAVPAIAREVGKLPNVKLLNLVDEALLWNVAAGGAVTDECKERMAIDIGLAVSAGSDAVLTSCNAYSTAVLDLQDRFAPLPLLAIDQPMVDKAIDMASRIGILGTVKSGIEQQKLLVSSTARRRGRSVEVESVLCEEAFEALTTGDASEHDRLLLALLPELSERVDVVLLAQASMSRLMDILPAGGSDILASPELAVEELSRLLGILDH